MPLYKLRLTGREMGYFRRNTEELGGLPDLICDLASRLEERLTAPLMVHLHRTNLTQVPNSGFLGHAPLIDTHPGRLKAFSLTVAAGFQMSVFGISTSTSLA